MFTGFVGEYRHTIDEKGRLAIPARFRTRFAEGLVVTAGMDRCLAVYSMEEWDARAAKLAQLPTTDPEARRLVLRIGSRANHCQLDGQGRVTIPAPLRDFAGLGSEAVVVGAFTHLQVWAKDLWDASVPRMEDEGSFIAENLVKYGI